MATNLSFGNGGETSSAEHSWKKKILPLGTVFFLVFSDFSRVVFQIYELKLGEDLFSSFLGLTGFSKNLTFGVFFRILSIFPDSESDI